MTATITFKWVFAGVLGFAAAALLVKGISTENDWFIWGASWIAFGSIACSISAIFDVFRENKRQ